MYAYERSCHPGCQYDVQKELEKCVTAGTGRSKTCAVHRSLEVRVKPTLIIDEWWRIACDLYHHCTAMSSRVRWIRASANTLFSEYAYYVRFRYA